MQESLIVNFKRLDPEAMTPTYATDGSGAFDLYARIPEKHRNTGKQETSIGPFQTVIVGTGIAVEVPPGYSLLLLGRSGHGAKKLRLGNCVGLIDSDYRGEVKVILHYDEPNQDMSHGYDQGAWVKDGERIAQGFLVATPRVTLVEKEELASTERGAGGFGSTGT